MAGLSNELPDLCAGVALHRLADGAVLTGRVGDDEVLLLRSGCDLFAVGAHCTHYGGTLSAGLVADGTLRCPLHHARFDLRSGAALCAPALDPIACWRVERRGDVAFVRERLPEPGAPRAIVIVGGGAAALAAADTLRRAGYGGKLTMVSADSAPPCDRPNLSKDYLAGEATEEWLPLRPPEYYTEQDIELLLESTVVSLDLARRHVRLAQGREIGFDSLLLATGAEPVPLRIDGATESQVHHLRSLADSRAIIERSNSACAAVVVGSSFIGLEVAASLRARGIPVHVVAPGAVPMERVLGIEVGRFLQGLHEAHGVRFHMGRTVSHIDGPCITLSDGSALEADLVVAGVGVRPVTALAEQAGLGIDSGGVTVDEYLKTTAPGVYAAGDIACWPDLRSGARIRVEHWVVAQRQGQVAALNMLGRRQRFDSVPFFWSQHYDTTIRYVGHATHWDVVDIDGSLAAGSATISYCRAGETLAVATVSRDLVNLQCERALELARI